MREEEGVKGPRGQGAEGRTGVDGRPVSIVLVLEERRRGKRNKESGKEVAKG